MEGARIAVPKIGFYHHYKHDPKKGTHHFAYEVLGIAMHTESDCRPEDVFMVSYRPLYESAQVFKTSQQLGIPCFDCRPLKMWMGEVEHKGVIVPRFTLVTRGSELNILKINRGKMYGRTHAS